jgi:hypothetical protein
MSVVAPAGTGTIQRIGRVGKFCACEFGIGASAAAEIRMMDVKLVNRCMAFLRVAWGIF